MKKRRLTVELWNEGLHKERALANKLGPKKFVELHHALGHDIRSVIFEIQMAEEWAEHGRQVYDFDRDFADSIVNEKWIDLLPNCLENRPHDCFFMKLPCGKTSEGVVVLITPISNVTNFEDIYFPGIYDGPGVYFGGVPDMEERAIVNTGKDIYALCSFAISKTPELMQNDEPVDFYPTRLVANGVAYICSANADIVPSYKPPKLSKPNNAKKRSMATWHDVGYRIGAELRSYERTKSERKEHQGGTVRPHVRRAHWHHYWTGPRDGERKLVLKWIAPTMVNVDSDIESATVHLVRAS